jgi:hypothetical protein
MISMSSRTNLDEQLINNEFKGYNWIVVEFRRIDR